MEEVMFDPEKVERFDVDGDSLSGLKQSDSHFVLSGDYDRLLADYREAISQIRTLIKERDALVPKSSETDPSPQASV